MSKRLLPGRGPVFSCELFPPRTEASQESFQRELPKLLALPFELITCTHGACGSNPGGTADTLREVRRNAPIELAAHLCCRGSTREEMRTLIEMAKDIGVQRIVALRGDRESEQGMQHADELVSLIKEIYPELKVVVGGYPEVHPESPTADEDLKYLKQKVECGADAIFTQFFFDNDNFFRYREKCEQFGISVPIIPGVMPVTSLAHIERLSQRCGAIVPQSLRTYLQNSTDEEKAGLDFTIRQVRQLLEAGVPGIHFYCLNKADYVGRIFEALREDLLQPMPLGA